ncbi:MAG: hypothetical protein D6734_11280 [Candidatus Schekmanbacteria bacterium]|nr:MAG: hypothetical protein D6734_11280 [Candidatus Schekmanbacteria bacterium]
MIMGVAYLMRMFMHMIVSPGFKMFIVAVIEMIVSFKIFVLMIVACQLIIMMVMVMAVMIMCMA